MKYSAIVVLTSLILASSLQLSFRSAERGISKAPRPVSAVEESLNMLGGVRAGLAAYLWVQTEEVHHHYYEDLSKEQELIPIYRLITLLDPRFIQAYDIGGYTLTLYGKKKEGLEFVIEGLKNNPKSPLLNMTAGQIYLFRFRDYRNAMNYFKKAIQLERDKNVRKVYANYYSLAEKLKNRSLRRGSSSTRKPLPSVPWKLFAD